MKRLSDHDNKGLPLLHGLRTPGEEITFTARPKIHFHSQIFRNGRSIFCLPHRPKFSDFFDLCLHWASIVRESPPTSILTYLSDGNTDQKNMGKIYMLNWLLYVKKKICCKSKMQTLQRRTSSLRTHDRTFVQQFGGKPLRRKFRPVQILQPIEKLF